MLSSLTVCNPYSENLLFVWMIQKIRKVTILFFSASSTFYTFITREPIFGDPSREMRTYRVSSLADRHYVCRLFTRPRYTVVVLFVFLMVQCSLYLVLPSEDVYDDHFGDLAVRAARAGNSEQPIMGTPALFPLVTPSENEWSPLYPERSAECAEHYDLKLLDLARNDIENMCIDGGDDSVRCSSTKHLNSCYFKGARVNEDGKWVLPCSLSPSSSHKKYFPKSWYNAGPGNQFLVHVDREHVLRREKCSEWIEEPTFLLTPECGGNMFHSFSEFLDWYLLRHLYHFSDFDRNIRYILKCDGDRNLTQHRCAPIYFERLSAFPVVRMVDVPKNSCFRHLITGRQMMGWYNFWKSLGNCHSTQIMLSFRSFWKNAFDAHIAGTDISTLSVHQNHENLEKRENETYRFCWLERLGHTRGWPEHREFFDALKEQISEKEEHRKLFENVEIEVVTPGYLDHTEVVAQYLSISKCNILAGTHGAGMVWSIFMKSPGVLLYVKAIKSERLEYEKCGASSLCWHDGFVNWARMSGPTVLFSKSEDASTDYASFQRQKLHGVDTEMLTAKIAEAVQIIKVN